jgi:hypothetical protein
MKQLSNPAQMIDPKFSEKLSKDLKNLEKGKTHITLQEKIQMLKATTDDAHFKNITRILGEKPSSKKYQTQFK